ncbi:MAG: GNAT family N-acetyltransferase, partial [Flavobacteriales bacterium]|nr:GNAT family N-acetyltransferase [Flavobacteriales bacterium]
MFEGQNIQLRALEPEDLEVMYAIENDRSNWLVSHTTTPFTKRSMRDYIDSLHDIIIQRQLRLVIEHENGPIGFVDLFEYEAVHQRCGLGIVIKQEFRGKGLAFEALKIVEEYATSVLQLKQLLCNVMDY